jgi:hypothetical protein
MSGDTIDFAGVRQLELLRGIVERAVERIVPGAGVRLMKARRQDVTPEHLRMTLWRWADQPVTSAPAPVTSAPAPVTPAPKERERIFITFDIERRRLDDGAYVAETMHTHVLALLRGPAR